MPKVGEVWQRFGGNGSVSDGALVLVVMVNDQRAVVIHGGVAVSIQLDAFARPNRAGYRRVA